MGFVEDNDRERARLRALVERLDEDDLRRTAYEGWTVAAVLAHVAFWDAAALGLARRLAAGEPFSPDDVEPDDVTWINDAARPLLDALAPREAAAVALRLAEETDAFMAGLPPERMYPLDPTSPVNPLRATHRAEHLDDLEALFGSG